MCIKLPSLAFICNHTGTSVRDAAAIARATLQDLGAITAEENTEIIDRMKIR